jgi:hypothetical protein
MEPQQERSGRVLDELYRMLNDAGRTGLSRDAQWRLIRIIGMIEEDELDDARRQPASDDRNDDKTAIGDHAPLAAAR